MRNDNAPNDANMNTRKTGQHYEERAAAYLQERGYKIVGQNYRCRYGEIDIIAYHQGYLVFIEVKYRKNEGSGHAVAAVDFKKQKKISGVARWYMMEKRFGEQTKCRFDVIGIGAKNISIIENAFDFIG